MTFLTRDSAAGVLAGCNLELRVKPWTARRVNQCQPRGNMGFLESLSRLFHGTFNICNLRKVISRRKVYRRCCSHFDKLDAMTLVWKPNVKANDIFNYYCGEGFYKERSRNNCTNWQWLFWIKLFSAIALHLRRNHCWAIKKRMSYVVGLLIVFETEVCC